MFQFFFLGAESEQSLRYALFQWDRMDSLFEFSEQPLNPPKSPSREVLELGLSRGRLSLWPVAGLELRAGAAVRQVALGSRQASAGNCRLTQRPSSRPSREQGPGQWRRWRLCSSCRPTLRTREASCCLRGGSVVVEAGCWGCLFFG